MMPDDRPLSSNTEWQEWGKRDPLWGVASWPGKERGGDNPWSDAEFYKLGDDWIDFNAAWQAHGQRNDGIVLEIGSGAGRISRQLANTFQKVIASDVSADVLAYAKERVPESNIEWKVSNGVELPVGTESVDAVFSCHVFQHFPSNAAQLATFNEIYRVLRPDGSFFIHIPVHIFPETNILYAKLARRLYVAFKWLANAKAALQRVLMRLGGKPYMRGVSYEILALQKDLREAGFKDVTFDIVEVKTNSVLHTCVYGRR